MNKVAKIIQERSGGLCENCGRPAQDGAHISPKKMGGRKGLFKKIYDDARNRAAACRGCHDLIDLKRKELWPGERAAALLKFKTAAGWFDLQREYGGIL
jgi:hypothetical protein